MKIEILGDGCFLCSKMYENTLEALKLSGKEADVIKNMDIQKIAESKVMSMPTMIIDGVVKVSGKVPTVSEILGLIT